MTRLRHLAAINPSTPEFDRLHVDAPVPFVPLEAVWPSGLELSRKRLKSEVASGYTRFREGDIVVPKITPTFQADRAAIASGLEGGVAAGTTELHVIRVSPQVDRRYVRYLLSSSHFLRAGESEMVGVAGQKRVPDEWLRNLDVPVTALTEQQEIADFLDAEIARIDAIVGKKRQLLRVLGERREGQIEIAVRKLAETWGELPLKFVVDGVTVGIVVTPSAWYAESGVPALRGINVKPGQIQIEDMVQISEEGHALHRKSALRSGDVVVVRTGQAGAAAVVPPDLAGSNCIDLIVIRPGQQIDPTFLEFVLNSDWTQKHVEEHWVGTIQSHFNVAAMKQLPVPRAPRREQLAVASRLAVVTREIDETVERLERQNALLKEHRQALITAAVTGELDIPKVAA